MRRYLWLLPALAALVVVGGPLQAAPAKACSKGKVLRVTNGAKACVSAKAFRQRPTTITPATAQLQRALDSPVKLRLRSGKVVQSVLPRSLAKAVLRAYPALEADMIAALRDAQAHPATARENAVTATALRLGTPTVNADGSGWSISGSISASLDGPGNVVVDIGISGNTNGAMGIDLNLSFDGADGARSSRGFTIKDVLSKPRQECPSATGAIRFENRFGGGSRSSETFGSKRVKLGTVRQATTFDMSSQATATMGPDARLKPFTFSVSSSTDYARTAQVLAFFGSQTRVVATGTMTGTMNPQNGQISGASVSTKVRSSGFGNDGASAEGAFRAALEKIMNEEGGRVLKGLREVETRARAGECTTLVLTPGSSALAPKATANVVARLDTKKGGDLVRTVRWAAVAAKGSVAPTTSKVDQPTLAVKGAAAGPETARITVKAVSPAGISTGTWVGTDEEFPPSYSGTVSYTGSLGVINEAWNGTFTYARPVATNSSTGGRRAVYALTSATVQSHVGSGECSWTSGPGGTINGGELVIQVDTAGAWTSALMVNVVLPSVERTCLTLTLPPTIEPLAAVNTRALAGSALRTMTPSGTIAGNGVTDTLTAALLPATASWSLAPGS